MRFHDHYSISNIIREKSLTSSSIIKNSATLERGGQRKSSMDFLRTFIILFMVAFIQKLTTLRRRRRESEQILKERSSPMQEEEEEEIRRSEVVFFVEEEEWFELDELLEGAAELRTQGFCSSLYVVRLRNGNGAVYAVKRLRKLKVSCEEFGLTMGKIGNLRHPNLLPLVCYNNALDEKLLVYKFQPNGSLLNLFESYAQGKRAFPWKLRLSIGVGIARGLNFIYSHEEIIPHGIIKLSNIMLNKDDEPLISEYGYAKLVLAGTDNPGYAVPEKDMSEKSDVYSFGIILLELLAGKAVEMSGCSDLRRWVRPVERMGQVFDEEISDVEMYTFPLLNLSLKCVDQKPHERPHFAEVLEKIEEIASKCPARNLMIKL